MLLALANWLAHDVRAFGVLNYLTLRAVFATMTALIISFIVGPTMIRKLTVYKIGQAVRDDGPQTHLTKAGTPTMGGALILVAIAATTLLWADLSNRLVWVVLIVTLGFGIVGWVDDYRKVVHRNPKGLPARWKYFWQSVIGLAAAIYLNYSSMPGQTEFIVPFFKFVAYPMGALGFIVLSYFVIVGTSNAVNLTDGLDGLASGCLICAGSAMTWIAWAAGDPTWSARLALPMIEGSSEMAIVGAAMLGSLLGFLRFNRHPAAVFMGNTGSLSLGGLLGLLAVITRQEILLAVIGGVFVAEAASVILQVASYRWRKRRVFLCAPIHHHFQLLGMPEPTIVLRFWIVAALCAAGGLTLLGAGGLREADSVPQTASLQRLTR